MTQLISFSFKSKTAVWEMLYIYIYNIYINYIYNIYILFLSIPVPKQTEQIISIGVSRPGVVHTRFNEHILIKFMSWMCSNF